MSLKFPISLVGKRESLQEETQVIDTNEDVIATIIGDIPNGYFDQNTNVRRVIVGSSCTSIGSTAFRCASPHALREVNFTNAVNLITIGQLSFSRARYLNTDLIFPDSLQTFVGADVFNVAGAGGSNTACKYIYFGKDTQSFGTQNFGYFVGVTRVDMNMLNVPSGAGQFLIGNSIAVIHAPSNSNFGPTYAGFTVVKDLPAL